MRKEKQANGNVDRMVKKSTIIGIVGIVVAFICILFMQTYFSLRQQERNSAIKLNGAAERIESQSAELADSWDRYDTFSQAKADVLSYYYERNLDKISNPTDMANVWQLNDIFIIDSSNNLLGWSDGSSIHYDHSEAFSNLIKYNKAFTRGDIRYYASAMNNGYKVIVGRNCAEFSKTQEDNLSYTTALSNIKVSRVGFVMAVSKYTGRILYARNENLIGMDATELGLDFAEISDGTKGFIKFNNVSYYCQCKSDNNGNLLIALMPTSGIVSNELKTIIPEMVVLIIVIVIQLLFGRFKHIDIVNSGKTKTADDEANTDAYMGCIKIFNKRIHYHKLVQKRIKNLYVLGIIIVFFATYYSQLLISLSTESVLLNNRLNDIEISITESQDDLERLTLEYNQEFSRKASNLAYLLAADTSLINDTDITEIATRAQIRNVYIYRNDGTIETANTVRQNITLSTSPEDSSYEFWDVINGYEPTIVQDAIDDGTKDHNYIQFIGTKRLDAPGMVQIGINPQRLKNRIRTTTTSYILEFLPVENNGFVFSVNSEDGSFAYFPEQKYIGAPAYDFGLEKVAMLDDYSGYQTINDQKCFVICRENNGTYIYAAAPVSAVTDGILQISVLISVLSMIITGIILVLCLIDKKENIVNEYMGREDHNLFELHKGLNAEEKLRRAVGIIIIIVAICLTLYIIIDGGSESPIVSYILSKKWEKCPNIFSFTYIVIILTLAVIGSMALRHVINLCIDDMGAKTRTIGKLFNNFIKYFVVIGALFYSLNFIGVDATTLLASAGILTLIVGLGAQSLVSDILTGVFIIFEGEFEVGDMVTLGDWRGRVLEVGIRSTKIEDGLQNIKIINNSEIKGVINLTKKFSYSVCDVGVDYHESLERIEAVLRDELPEIKKRNAAILDGPFYKGVVSLGDSSVVIRILATCNECDRIQLGRDLNREIKLIFDKHDINIPFPQVVINKAEEHLKRNRYQDVQDKIKADEFVKEQKEQSKDLFVDSN